jgi:hypothetical protein
MCVSVGWSAPLPTRHHADTPTRPHAPTLLRSYAPTLLRSYAPTLPGFLPDDPDKSVTIPRAARGQPPAGWT